MLHAVQLFAICPAEAIANMLAAEGRYAGATLGTRGFAHASARTARFGVG